MVLDVAADTLQPPKRSFTTTIRGMFGGWATRLAMGIIVLVVGAVILAPLISPDNPLTQNIGSVLSKPSSAHWLGTDTLGRDVLSRLLYGGRTTLLAVTLALAVYLVIGVVAGLVAGYASGWADQVVSFVVNVLMSIPGIVVVLSVAAILKDNEFAIMTALGVILSVSLIRVVRAETRAVRSSLYVEAATIAGIGRAPGSVPADPASAGRAGDRPVHGVLRCRAWRRGLARLPGRRRPATSTHLGKYAR